MLLESGAPGGCLAGRSCGTQAVVLVADAGGNPAANISGCTVSALAVPSASVRGNTNMSLAIASATALGGAISGEVSAATGIVALTTLTVTDPGSYVSCYLLVGSTSDTAFRTSQGSQGPGVADWVCGSEFVVSGRPTRLTVVQQPGLDQSFIFLN